MPSYKYLFMLMTLCLVVASACSANDAGDVPADFTFVIDVKSAEDNEEHTAQNVNSQINAEGEGQYERYDTGGVIRGDANDGVMYGADQVLAAGEFKLEEDELRQLWEAIQENKFFEVTGDYRMAIGHSYAFIMVEADGRRHQVFNIGLEVPEIRAIVEATEAVLPEGVDIEYGEGFKRGEVNDNR